MKLSDKKAWEMIAQMGWGKTSVNYKALAREFYAKFGTAQMKALQQFVGNKAGELYAAVRAYEDQFGDLEVGSDDSFSDLRCHVVGLGKAEFELCRDNPEAMQVRYKNHDYKESFAYCFHEPEPERTQLDKDTTMAELLAGIESVNKDMQALVNKTQFLQMKIADLVHFANMVKKDRTE